MEECIRSTAKLIKEYSHKDVLIVSLWLNQSYYIHEQPPPMEILKTKFYYRKRRGKFLEDDCIVIQRKVYLSSTLGYISEWNHTKVQTLLHLLQASRDMLGI